MGCQDARPVFRNTATIEQKSQFLKVQAICRECKKSIFKNYKLSDFPALKKKFNLVDVLELYDFKASTDKTHIHAQMKNTTSESLQRDLFQ